MDFATTMGENLKKAFTENGLIGLKEALVTQQEHWKHIPIKIAVLGSSGVGKSSFINTMRRLHPGDKHAALTGVNETTTKVQAYPAPAFANFVLYDIPGVGTPQFPKDSYLKTIEVDTFDFFIIISATRFTENDVWLGQEIRKIDRVFFYVRTKIDIDIENEIRKKKDSFDLKECLGEIRNYTQKELNLADIEAPVYLITTRLDIIEREVVYDYDELTTNLVNAAPKIMKEALILSLPALTKDVVLQKENVLRSRIKYVAAASGIFGTIPVPGLGELVDTALFINEAVTYQKTFNLDEASLADLATTYEIKIEKLALATRSVLFTANGLASFGLKHAGDLAEEAVKFGLPGIGSVVAGVLSYGGIYSVLATLLHGMKTDALTVNRTIEKRIIEQGFK